jgi:type IV pilus assembly protein PilB
MKEYVKALSDILCRDGVLSKHDARALVQDFRGTDKEQLNYFLVDEGLVSQQELLRALGEYYQLPYFDVRGYQFNHDLLALFPQDFLVRNAIIPIQFDENILTVAVGDPEREDLRSNLRNYMVHHIEFNVGIVRDIVDEIRAYYEEPPSETGADEEDIEEESTEDILDMF